jgi:hypothetical protein
VDPYTAKLNEDRNGTPVELEISENIDPEITKDVDLMWFYPKKEFA